MLWFILPNIVLLQLASHSCSFYAQKMSGQFESIIYLIYFASLSQDESHPLCSYSLKGIVGGFAFAQMNLTLISSPEWSIFFRRRSILWIAVILISLYGQRIFIADVNVHVCKSILYFEIFFQGQTVFFSCPQQNMKLVAWGMVAISHIWWTLKMTITLLKNTSLMFS